MKSRWTLELCLSLESPRISRDQMKTACSFWGLGIHRLRGPPKADLLLVVCYSPASLFPLQASSVKLHQETSSSLMHVSYADTARWSLNQM